jgi:microfibrillar-associated protein 1
MVTDFNKPDDRDLTDDEEEFEEWKLREMRRLARELEEKEARLHEESELLRRRSMTQAERDAEDVRLIAAGLRKDAAAPREKRGFMQRYYHKGVFYMDEKSMDDGAAAKMRRDFAEPVAKDDVRRRSYNEATGEDRVNKSALPEVMQVRKFGLKGRTKYTHLRDQDTSQQEKSLWSDAQRDQRMRSKYESRMGGVHGGVDGAAAMARRASQKRPREAAEK